MNLRSPRETARAIFIWLISGAAAVAQQSSVEVRSPSAKLLDAAPGRIITASVVIANRGGQAEEFTDRLTIPPGCQRVSPPELPFRVEAGGQTVRVLAIALADNMPAGRFDIRYTAQSRRDPSSIDSVDLAIQVAAVDNLEFIVDPPPATVIAGDTYVLRPRVTNHGNSRVNVQLTFKSDLGFKINAEACTFPLEAGASREIVCHVVTEKSFPRHASHAVNFKVAATAASGKTLTASRAAIVEVIPLISGSRDPFHHLPVQLRTTVLMETGHAAQFQAEVSGAGSLDEAGEHRIDFLLRGPDVQNSSFFGERDEYGVSYHGANWDVDLGDRTFVLSPLTEKQTFGRGAGVTWHEDKTVAGGFYMSTRYRQRNSDELGAFVRRDLTDSFSLQANFLRKSGGEALQADALPQNIVTLESHYRVGKGLDLRLESGVSRSDEGVTDNAWRAEAHGELPGNIGYAIEHAHAGSKFRGYYSGNNTTYASATKAITAKFRVHASLNQYKGDLARNDIRSNVVNRENSWTGGANYSVTKSTEFSVDWRHTERADILKPVSYDFVEDSVRTGLGQSFGKLRLQSFLDLGTLDNHLTGESGKFQRYTASLHWTPTAHQSYSVFAGYGPSAFTAAADKALNVGVSARWQLKENLTTDLSCARNQYDGLIGREQDQALASVRYQFEDKSSLSVVGRWLHSATKDAAAKATNEAAVLVTYSIPLSLPVSRKRSIGVLQGRVFDATKGREAGLARVVLQVGEQFAVTDSAGIFEFPALKPGPCELRVVQDSLGARMAMETPLPKKLRIRPAETTSVELAAAPACSVSVRLTRYEFADGNSLTASGALREDGSQEAVTVELTDGRDVWRAQTDRTGGVAFDRLPGGRWTLRAASSDLPALHAIENPERTLVLKPGESQQVALRVLPQRRTLRVLDHGTIR